MIEELPPPLLQNYDKALICLNVASTGGRAACAFVRHSLETADNLPMPIGFLETSEDSKVTEQKLADNIDPEKWTVIGVVGGDGTVRQCIQFFQDSQSIVPNKQVAIWTAGGGSGSNLMHSTITKEVRWKPDQVLQTGRVDTFNPIRCVIKTPEGQKYVLYAGTVIGLGATHHIIAAINHEGHRARRIRNVRLGHIAIGKYLVDPPEMLMGLSKAPLFEIEEGGEITTTLESLHINGPWVGEVVHAPEVFLSGPVHSLKIDRKKSIPSTFIKLRKGRSPGHDLIEPHIFRTTGELPFQVDGEDAIDGKPLVLKPGTKVKIEQSKRSLAVVTNQPRI